MSLGDLFNWLFKTEPKAESNAVGTPADHKEPHDARGGETVDEATGIGMIDGQELDNTEIDPTIQDREHGFPVKDPENPEK